MLLITFVAGGFSLHRLDPALRRFGELAYVRTWLLLAIAAVMLLHSRSDGRAGSRSDGRAGGRADGRFSRGSHGGPNSPTDSHPGRHPQSRADGRPQGRPHRPQGRSRPRLAAAAAFTHAVAISQLYIALTALWSPDAAGTFPRVFGQLVLALLLELALLALRRGPARAARTILNGSLAAALLYAVAGLAGGSEHGRMAMFFGGPNVFIRVIGGGVLASVYRALATRRLIWLAPAPLLLVCAVESGSRGGMLALLFTLPVVVWAVASSGVLRRRPGWWLAVPLAGALALAAAGYYVLTTNSVRRYVEQRYLVYAPSAYDPAEVDLGSRDRLFAAALETFLAHPVLGFGLSPIGEFERLDAHPHNLFLATARDGGIAGLLLLGIPFALLALRLGRPLAIEQRMAFVLGCFYLCAAQFSGSYYDCRFVWLYFLIAMPPAALPLPHRRPHPTGPRTTLLATSGPSRASHPAYGSPHSAYGPGRPAYGSRWTACR